MYLNKNIHEYTKNEFWAIVDQVEREKREAKIVPEFIPSKIPDILECVCGVKFSPKKHNQVHCSTKCGTRERVRIHRANLEETQRKLDLL